ncbi:MAG: hypothetical protein OEY86_20715, partial [Nitrospira sp.]|nr:hypothetical protein [Nitrospira sp.]
MLIRLVLILALIPLPACSLFAEVHEGIYGFEPSELGREGRDLWERDKRESLDIVDLKVGNGPLAAWGRRFEADIEVRYLDGTLVYKGRIFNYIGFVGDTSIHNAASQRRERGMLAQIQIGIAAGINGMGIGGQRRITIKNPLLVCSEPYTINPEATCWLTEDGIRVHQRPLVVEATLTESCIPQVVVMPSIASGGR